jgi:hypothetical protein
LVLFFTEKYDKRKVALKKTPHPSACGCHLLPQEKALYPLFLLHIQAQNQNIFMKNARLTPTGILVSSLTALIYWIVLPNSRSFAK